MLSRSQEFDVWRSSTRADAIITAMRRVVAITIFLAAVVVVFHSRTELSRHPIVATRLLAATPPAHLPVPVRGVAPRQLSNTWGSPRPEGRRHQGIDIFASRGREVVSTTTGIVATVGTSRRGGNIVRILGPGGQWHYYAHLQSFGRIHVGQVIVRGTVLGYVGDTGNAKGTPPHLHYGIYRFRGGAINPYPILMNSGA